PCEVQRRTNERLAETVPVRRVVAGATVRVAIPRGSIRLPLVHELGRDDLAIAEFDAVPPDLLVEDRELIALAHVLNELDVPFEDAREVHHELVRHAGLHSGFEQRRTNDAVRANWTHLELALERARLEPGLLAGDREHADVVELAP